MVSFESKLIRLVEEHVQEANEKKMNLSAESLLMIKSLTEAAFELSEELIENS